VSAKPSLQWIAIVLLLGVVVVVYSTRNAGTPGAPPEQSSEHVRVLMRGVQFDPPEVTIPVGATVDWIDVDGRHGVQLDVSGPGDRDDTIEPGGSISRTFHEPGRYPYHCVVHGGVGGQGMSGVVIVTP
jgi:plastocyanin